MKITKDLQRPIKLAMKGSDASLDQVIQAINQRFEALNESMTLLARSALRLSWSSRRLNDDLRCRLPGEHPVDWVLRVGREISGHNIYEGEAWRFRVLRDWWQGDDVDDEYGTGWKR